MRRELFVRAVAQQPFADADGDIVRVECALDREKPVALLILLADAHRLVDRAVELFAYLHLDERPLFLDYDNEIEALGELGKLLPADRPHTGNFEDAQAEIVALHLVDTELIERLVHIEVGFSGRDNADFRRSAAGSDDPIESVGAHEGQHRIALEVVQARFLSEDRVDKPDIEPAVRHPEMVWRDDLDAIDRAVDHAGRLDRLVHTLERRPCAGEARHRPAIERVVDDFLHAGRIEDRHHNVDEVEFRLMRGGRRFSRVIVSHQRDDAAVLGGAGKIGVTEDVAGPIDARTFTVPHAEYAIEFAFAAQFGLLRSPERGGGKFLVDAGLELHIRRRQYLPGAHELLVKAAERRAAIAGDVAGRVQTGAAIALLLHEAGADQCLIAGHEDM